MTISTKRQSLSNMLRQLFAFLILGGLIAIYSCEPVNRKTLTPSTTVECTDDEDDVPKCETIEATEVSTPNNEDQTRIGRKFRQKFLDDDDDVTSAVSARKKNKGGRGRLLLYIVAAMKAALIYGILHGVAALAGKAVLVAKIALAIAIAAILKKNDHESVSYEIIKHPHTSYIQTHSSSIDYDHRSDYGEDRYDHRKRRRIL